MLAYIIILLAESDAVLHGLGIGIGKLSLPLDQPTLLCPVAVNQTLPISCAFYIPLK